MSSKKSPLQLLLDQAVAEHGARRVRNALKSLIVDSRNNVLTIIANAGRHNVPQKYLRGEIFVASEGNIDFSSHMKIKNVLSLIILRLNTKLLQNTWTKIYLIPTGHPTLSLQLKIAVYRVTRLNTTDLFYLNGRYFDIDFDMRNEVDRHHAKHDQGDK